MDGRAEGMRIERDPTMDHRIVHSVCVYNKKEQAQLKDTERNLQNEFKVEQHIIRREEKELLKQFQKLQFEKYHRHPEELHSPRPSFRRVVTPHIMVPSRHSMHRSLVSSPMSSRHELADRTRRHTSHHPSQPTASNFAMKSSHIHQTYPSSSYVSSNIGSSFVSSNNSLKRGTESRPYLPLWDAHTRNPGSLTVSRDDFHRHEGISDNDHDTTHHDGHPSKSHHLMQHHHHHHHQHHHHVSNEIQGFLESYLSPHQPAGYGHSIKELNEHRDTIRRRHRLHHDSHKRRRHTVDFDCPQNYRHVGNLHLLNEIGPYGPKLAPQKSNLSDGKTCTTERPKKNDNEPLTNKTKQQQGGSEIVERKTSRGVTAVLNDHKPGDGAEVFHKNEGDVVDRSKKQHGVTDVRGTTVKEGNEQNLQITIKINRKERNDKTGQKQNVAFTSIKGTDTNAGTVSTLKDTSNDDTHRKTTTTHHGVAKSRSSLISGHKEITPVIRVRSPEEKQDARYISTENDSTGSSDHGSVDLPSDTLAELQALSGSSTQGFFTAQGSGFASRRNRFKQLAKELLMKQIPALTRKRQLAEFDPLEALQCRYLRLSPSNIQDLVDKCKESGIEVDIHPHTTIEDINEFVFGKGSSSSSPKDTQ